MTDAAARSGTGTGARAAAIVAALARIALGVLWINEAALKFAAGFGRADILLVAHSAATNSRVPWFYKLFAADVVAVIPGPLGVLVPLIELGLGVALVLGVLTLPAALASTLELVNYWSADQLIAQYPVMIALSAAVAAFAVSASRYSVTSLVLRGPRRVPSSVRRWL